MKFNILIFISIIFIWTNSCTTRVELPLSSISKDSLYIQQNISWQTPSHDIKGLYADTNFITGLATVDLLKLDKSRLLFITTSVMKTADDSIILFWPPENGGTLIIGRLSPNLQIESHAKFNGEKIEWTTKNSIKLDNHIYDKLSKTNMDWFREVINKYSYAKGRDSAEITLAGP